MVEGNLVGVVSLINDIGYSRYLYADGNQMLHISVSWKDSAVKSKYFMKNCNRGLMKASIRDRFPDEIILGRLKS